MPKAWTSLIRLNNNQFHEAIETTTTTPAENTSNKQFMPYLLDKRKKRYFALAEKGIMKKIILTKQSLARLFQQPAE